MKTAHLHVDCVTHQEFKRWCKDRGESMQQVLEQMIRQHMAEVTEQENMEHANGESRCSERKQDAKPDPWSRPPFWADKRQ